MLKDILKSKKCFKFICAAGNEDAAEIEKLCTLFSASGAQFFDVGGNIKAIKAAKRGFKRAKISGVKEKRYLCVSLGLAGDKHVNKGKINPKKCTRCGACASVCTRKAIIKENDIYEINKTRCIGCEKCISTCKTGAIGMKSENRDIDTILPLIIKEKIDCIELHAKTKNKNEIISAWNKINSQFKGMMSLCIDRSVLSNEDIIDLIKELIKSRAPYSVIIQADGAPMSGGKNDYKTTLQTVAMADIIRNADLPVFILLSGGTNSKSSKLAKMCNIEVSGVSIGSYARKIVAKYTARDDFYEDKTFTPALKKARKLVCDTLKYL